MFGGKKNYVAGTWLKAMNRNEKEGKKIRNKKKMFLSTKNLKYFKIVVIFIYLSEFFKLKYVQLPNRIRGSNEQN